MILKPFYFSDLAQASYLVLDHRTRMAVVVDPQRDIEPYLRYADGCGARIRYVFLTHFHADFVAGHLEFHVRTGAEICLGAKARARYPFRAFRVDDVLEFGGVRLRVLETPGHTPEAISIVVYDLAKSPDRPDAVLTGDTLFIGDVGRPDLMVANGVGAGELASQLYDSLHKKLATLPDETLVYPAHGSGSFCGKQLSDERVSTIGAQLRSNWALQPMTKSAFVDLVTSDQPEPPPYFPHAARLNQEKHRTLKELRHSALVPRSLDEVLDWQRRGGQIVNVRPSSRFAGGHLAGSLNIGLDGKFVVWAGTMLSPKVPMLIIADSGQESNAVTELSRIGYDSVQGYLDGGLSALAGRPELVRKTRRISVQTLKRLLTQQGSVMLLDVRTLAEWNAGHIETSINIPLAQLCTRLGELPWDKPIVVYCASGYRSSIAASVLARAGYPNVMELDGGFQAWSTNVGASINRESSRNPE